MRYLNVWQLRLQTRGFAALALCLALATAGGEAVAQGGRKVAAPWVGKTAEGQPCKGGQPTSGPFDYLKRRQFAGQLQVVEEHHFDDNVKNLIKGISTEPMGDIDFTLRSFPNHHHALESAVKFRLRHKRWPERSKGVRAECYLQRAINFSPRDAIPYSLLGYTMHKLGKPEHAVGPYETAIKMLPGDMMLKYNLGLALTELERWVDARVYAEQVYAVGFPLPALRERLLAVGHWEGATVPPKGVKQTEAPEQLSKKEQFARALAKQWAADGGEEVQTAEDTGDAALSKKEQFAAILAARQAEEAKSGTETDTTTAAGAGETPTAEAEEIGETGTESVAEAEQAKPDDAAPEADTSEAEPTAPGEALPATAQAVESDDGGESSGHTDISETVDTTATASTAGPNDSTGAAPVQGDQPAVAVAAEDQQTEATAPGSDAASTGQAPDSVEQLAAADADSSKAEAPAAIAETAATGGETRTAASAEQAPEEKTVLASGAAFAKLPNDPAAAAKAANNANAKNKAQPGGGNKQLTKKEKLAAAILAAAQDNGAGPAGDNNQLANKEKFAAALAAQGQKKEAALADIDPETRKEQFAARLAAKGLLESEETPEGEASDEGSAE